MSLARVTLGPTPVRVSRMLRATAWATVLFTLGMTAFQVATHPPGRIAIDYDIFYRIARITAAGDLAKAYDLDRAAELARTYPTDVRVVPYAYPPTASLFLEALTWVPAWLGYLVTQILGLALYAAILRAVAGAHRDAVFVAAAPAMILNVCTGQNGLLTAGLAGLVALALKARAPGPLIGAAALLTLKPHLALGPPLALAILRRWKTLAALGLASVGLSAVGLVVFGPPTALAWIESLRQSNAMLALGLQGPFPIRRMVSVYATLRTYGVSHLGSLTAHAGIASLALVATLRLGTRDAPARTFALALISGLLVSPYLYDYDLAMVAMAVAILVASGDMAESRREYCVCLALVGIVPVPGFLTEWKLTGGLELAVGGPCLVILALLVYLTVAWQICLRSLDDTSGIKSLLGS